MSREVRRVPVGWQHPVELNPHWHFQHSMDVRNGRPASRLTPAGMRFVSLHRTSVSEAQAQWDAERAEWDAGRHEHLDFLMSYHSQDGWVSRDGTREEPNPYKVYDESQEHVVREFFPASKAEILAVYPYELYAGARPTAEDHMPDFDVAEDELGWCLYQTVSEGTPVTPVFATAEELIDHLATVGQDWDQVPMRRAAAEQLVVRGGSMGSMVLAGGVLYRSDVDADLIAKLPR